MVAVAIVLRMKPNMVLLPRLPLLNNARMIAILASSRRLRSRSETLTQ